MRRFLNVYQYTWRAAELVWQTSRRLTVAFAVLTIVGGLLPAAIAWVGQLIVDGVVNASQTGLAADRWDTLTWVAVEAILVASMAAVQRGIDVCQSLLRAQLGHRVNVMILDKALELDLVHFEDSEFYDKMTRARRQASQRARSRWCMRNVRARAERDLAGDLWRPAVAFSSMGRGSRSLAAAVPAFLAETRFSGRRSACSAGAPPRRVQADLPRDGHGPGGLRQGGQAAVGLGQDAAVEPLPSRSSTSSTPRTAA